MKRALLSATALALLGQFLQIPGAAASGFLVREHSAEGLATAYAGDLAAGDRVLGIPAWTAGLTSTWTAARWTGSLALARAAKTFISLEKVESD